MSTRPASRLAALSIACLALIALLVPHAADARSKPRQTGQLVSAPAKTATASSKAGRAFAAAQRKARKNARGKRGRKARKPKTTVPTSQTTATRSDLLFGAHVDGDVYGGNLAKTDDLERRLGRRVAISQWYQNWGGSDWIRSVQPQLIKAVADSGRTPLLTWEPFNADAPYGTDQPEFSLDAINDGRYDAYIASWADGLRDAGTPVYLRTMHEMNGDWYPWGAGVNGNTPAKYRDAWRHIVDIFRSRSASNVKFVWCPLVDNVPNTPENTIDAYYPGTDYVDVLSLDGYNWGTNRAGHGGWRSFEQVFGAAYKQLTKLGPQPIWIAEVGSAAQGGDKAAWVRDMFKTANRWDRLKALVWFDVNKEEDWRAAPDASVARAFAG